jgi:hypothetical protein
MWGATTKYITHRRNRGMNTKIEEAVKAAAKDGRITCKQALAIAGELGESPASIGKVINELKIKIKGCQLGCF